MAFTLNNLAFATVMDVTVHELEKTNGQWTEAGNSFSLDSLRISNITQEGPTKEHRGGLENKPIIRHGKTVRVEMEDVIIKGKALEWFMGADVDTDTEGNETISIGEKFRDKPLKIVGTTYMIDKDTGEREYVVITFHELIPDGVFDLSLEAEGDMAVFNMAGELFAKCGEYFTIGAGVNPCDSE